MNDRNQDARLRERFAQERADDQRHAPGFERLASGAPARVFSLRWGQLAIAAAAVLLACVAVATRPSTPVRAVAEKITAGSWPIPITPPAPTTQPVQAADNTQSWTTLCVWQASTDAFLPASSKLWGGTITATTDVWVGTGSDVSDSASTNGKEKS